MLDSDDEDDEDERLPWQQPQLQQPQALPQQQQPQPVINLDPALDDMDTTSATPLPLITLEQRLLARFPSFQPGKHLCFTELNSSQPCRESVKKRQSEHQTISLIEQDHPLGSQDHEALKPAHYTPLAGNKRRVTQWASRARVPEDTVKLQQLMNQFDASARPNAKPSSSSANTSHDTQGPADPAMVDLVSWEDNVVWGIDRPGPPPTLGPSLPPPTPSLGTRRNKLHHLGVSRQAPDADGIRRLNLELLNDQWSRSLPLAIPLDGQVDDGRDGVEAAPGPSIEILPGIPRSRFSTAFSTLHAPHQSNPLLDFYNLSNDDTYPPQKAQKITIRQTGLFDIVHAGPARKLQVPFYRPNRLAADKRALNRTQIHFPTGVPIHFDKLLPPTTRTKQQRDQAKAMERQGKKVEPEIPSSSSDLSMANRSPFVLLEYSEESPLALAGYGMGSAIINYYKKTFPDDTDYPHFKLGQPVILQPNDPQPYPLAFIDRGQSLRSLSTTFSNAPLFAHTPEPSDFLVIRTTIEGQPTRYYIREINHLFTVGQVLPSVTQGKQYIMDMPTSQAATRRGTRWIRYVIKKLMKRGDGIVRQSHLRPFWPDWSDRDWTLFLKVGGISSSLDGILF